MSNVRPINSSFIVGTIRVQESHVTLGGAGGGASSLEQLLDVDVALKSNGDLLGYNGIEWVNIEIEPNTHTFLSALNIPGVVPDNSMLRYNAALSEWQTVTLVDGLTPHSLESHLDVSGTPNASDVLAFFGGSWVPRSILDIITDVGGSTLVDDKTVKLSSGDSASGFLSDKIQAGTGVSFSTQSGPSGDTIVISATGGGGSFDFGVLPEPA